MKFFSINLDIKTIFFALLIIILLQFILSSFIFSRLSKLENSQTDLRFEYLNISNKLDEQTKQINALQATLMRLQSQFFRINNEDNN